MDWKQKYIEENYAGDSASFEDDWADSITRARRYVVDWKDISLNSKVLPELEAEVHDLIERYLGYLPHVSTTIEFEPYLKALLRQQQNGSISEINFKDQAIEHIKLIRNKDMEYNTCLKYDSSIYRAYEKGASPYKDIVRERLKRFLGYVPDLDHSLVAELWMQEIASRDNFIFDNHATSIDYKAITLVKYRELLIGYNKSVADNSALTTILFNT